VVFHFAQFLIYRSNGIFIHERLKMTIVHPFVVKVSDSIRFICKWGEEASSPKGINAIEIDWIYPAERVQIANFLE